MKLQQLQYLGEIVRQGLSISQAATALHTSQSGISRQVALLEQELGLQIFERNGKRLTGLTMPGQQIVLLAAKVLRDVDNLKLAGEESRHQQRGQLSIATTHTQARYFLPAIVKAFSSEWPDVQLTIHQGNPTQVAEQVANGSADLGIATEAISKMPGLLSLPCYQWNRCVVMPKRHPLLKERALTLEKLAQYPLITYDFAFAGGGQVLPQFEQAGLRPNIVLTAIDADVIKTYVKLGLGVGLVAAMAYDAKRDEGLAMRDASHLFPANTTYVGLRRQVFLRKFMADFIQRLVPGLTRKALDAGLASAGH
ncbi:MAG: CysB family HTH-type transcriptional regulator [Gammaproteobacteria bacterium]|jgi:LysR family cys regulon transcriptional activator